MIAFDGDRSLKRRWFAKKKLATIHEMNIPSACPVWDGFRFKVWQLSKDLDGGRVTAPMGAVVACSTQDGIKIAVADYWAGGFNPAQDLYVVFKDLGVDDEGFQNIGAVTTFFNGPIDPLETGEYRTIKFTPTPTYSYFGLVNGDSGGPATVMAYDYAASPVFLPVRGEVFDVMTSASIDFDLNGNGTPDWFRAIFEKTTTFYIANGVQASRMNCGVHHVQFNNSYNPKRIFQKSGTDRYTSHQSTALYDFVDDDGISRKVVGYNVDVATSAIDNIYFSEILNTDMPEALRTILTTSENDGSCEPVGAFASDSVFFHAVNASGRVYSDVFQDCAATDYYDDNPAQEKWSLFYSMTVGGNVHLVNSDQFLSLLDDLATVPVIGDWFGAKRMFEQIAGAYPNLNFAVPYDSIMFQGHDGIIYTWTRAYGSVKFTTTGIFLATVLVPTQVSGETGVRPEITYAGLFGDTHLYLCVSNKVKVGVRAVHYGSPFFGWAELPGCPEGVELVSARPCVVTPERIFLIGVVKHTVEEIIEGVPTEVEKYAFASLNWTAATDDEEASTDPWRVMGELPFPVGDADNFALGLYGDDPRASALAVYQCPPILPQAPVGPYDKYAIGMP